MRLPPINLQTCIEALLQSLDPQHSKIEKIILFGSAARGEARGTSDLDVVIIEKTRQRFVIRSQKYYRKLKVPCAVDLLVYTPQEFERMREEDNSFLRGVIAEGITIYEKKPPRRRSSLVETGPG